MVLDADVTTSWEILERDAKLIPAAIRVLVRCIPVIQIGADDFFVVKRYGNNATITCDSHLIPLTCGFTSIPGRPEGIVKRTAVVISRRRFTVCI